MATIARANHSIVPNLNKLVHIANRLALLRMGSCRTQDKNPGKPENCPACLGYCTLPERTQISITTGMIIGRRPVVFWIYRFNSTRTFSFTTP